MKMQEDAIKIPPTYFDISALSRSDWCVIAVCPFLGLDCMKIRRSSSMARRPALGFDHYWAVHNISSRVSEI